jgi:hypothetical protein
MSSTMSILLAVDASDIRSVFETWDCREIWKNWTDYCCQSLSSYERHRDLPVEVNH